MESTYLSGDGMIVDLRSPDRYTKGTIPGSINIPFAEFELQDGNAELQQQLEKLGVRARGEVGAVVRTLEKLGMFDGEYKTDRWDFTNSRDVLLWCDDALCEESPRAIRALVSLGYPPEKLFYYRGGMRMWQSLGLTTVVPEAQSAFASK
jgi:rhodanese-related sulfurtransferase